MTTVGTPWGRARVVEEVVVPQRAGAKRFSTRLELLDGEDTGRLVRVSYATSGAVRRGPVTLREQDLTKLAVLLDRTPDLRDALARATKGGSMRTT
jgi:hypothetical protein